MVPLRSDWDMDKQRMFEIETVPIEASQTLSPLASLAYDAEFARLQDASKAVEVRAKKVSMWHGQKRIVK